MTVYECVIEGTLDDNPCLTVLHYDISGSTDFQALADAIADIFAASFTSLLVSSLRWEGITLREDTPGGVGTYYAFSGGSEIGSATNPEYWGTIACLVRKLTSSGNKPTQGRIFQGGIPATQCTSDGAVNASYRGSLASAWDDMISVVFDTTGVADMVIKASNPSAPNTVAYNPVTSMAARPYSGKQSRRNYQN